MKWTLHRFTRIVALAIFVFVGAFAGAAIAQNRTPRIPCAECGGPTGGAYSDPHGTTLCQWCVGDNPVWNERTGTWVPGPGGMKGGVGTGGGGGGWRAGGGWGGGGGGRPAACGNACHGGAGRSRLFVSDQSMVRYGGETMKSPHMGNELELMLQGTKPLAAFAGEAGWPRTEVVPEGFDTALAEGRLVTMAAANPVTGGTSYYFALPDEAWRLRVMRSYTESGSLTLGGHRVGFTKLEHQQFLGEMLGYEASDTHGFVKANAIRMHGRGELTAEAMAPFVAPSVQHDEAVISLTAAPRTGWVSGMAVLPSGRGISVSVPQNAQWRGKALASVLNDVDRWKHDAPLREDVRRLLRWLARPKSGEDEILMAWAEAAVP
jgi:hypothetical protein